MADPKPVVLTEDALEKMLGQDTGSSTPEDEKPPQVDERSDREIIAGLSTPQMPPVEPQQFGTPTSSATLEQILGHPITPSVPVTPPAPKPEDIRQHDRRVTADPLTDMLERKETEKTRKAEASGAEVALRQLMKMYPSTRLVNLRIFWQNPTTQEYQYKGSRRNVNINDVRNPDNIVAPWGRRFTVSIQPINSRWDDEKTWVTFEHERDGPYPTDEWTIDAPPESGLFMEVEGMGAVSLSDLKALIESTSTSATLAALRSAGINAPVAGQQQVPQPQYIQQAPPPQQIPARDLQAEQREKELKDELVRMRKLTEDLAAKAADREREATAAQHKAELDAERARQEADRAASKAALDAVMSKLQAVETRVNAPPPPPPPPPAPVQQGMDIATALITVAPHLKEIFVSNRNAETEAAKVRETALAEERRREADARDKDREQDRTERERDRDRKREEQDRLQQEMRERREAFTQEQQRMREESQRSMDMYRTLGEQSANNARMISEIYSKQSDPSGTMSVVKMATDSLTQQAQLFATLFKAGVIGGGAQASTVDWGRVLDNAFGLLGNVGATWAEAKARSGQQASRAANASLPPSPGPTPQRQPTATQQPLQGVSPQPAATVEVNPLNAFVEGVNQAIEAKEPPGKVAGKIAGIVHVAQEFGQMGTNKILQKLMEDPEAFLKRAYPEADPAYLKAVADLLIETFPPSDDDDEGDEDEDENATQPPIAASAPAGTDDGGNGQEGKTQASIKPVAAPVPQPQTPAAVLSTVLKRRGRPPGARSAMRLAPEAPQQAVPPPPAAVPAPAAALAPAPVPVALPAAAPAAVPGPAAEGKGE